VRNVRAEEIKAPMTMRSNAEFSGRPKAGTLE
jgi:hypothetical protein